MRNGIIIKSEEMQKIVQIEKLWNKLAMPAKLTWNTSRNDQWIHFLGLCDHIIR